VEQLLWTFDDALRFIHHPDHPVRSWALELMINRFPERAGDAVVDMLDDDNTYIVMRATDFLGDTGDGQRYGPALLEHLKQCTDERSGYYAEALGKLGYRQALPLMIDRLRPHPLQLKHSEFIRHVAALGALGGDEARQALWSILDALPVDAHALHHVADALLEAGLPDDVDRLVQRYRDWLPAPYRTRMLAAFASACNVDRLYEEMKQRRGAVSTRWADAPPNGLDNCPIIETIAQLARKFPGSCDEAVPLLVETVDDKQGDFVLEACETALVAIGPAAVGALAEAMRDDDISRQIYLSGALAHIPTERAARDLMDWIESSGGAEEYQIEALKDIGHPAAIDLLYEWWEPGDYLLSEALLVLCEVNGVHAPELPEWRDDVAEQDEEIEQALSEARGPLIDLYPPDLDEDEQEDVLEPPLLATRTRRETGQPKQRPAGKHREVSKKGKKKPAAQKKKAQKKKK